MRIAIVGYGKMGRIVEEAALSSSNEVVAVIDPFSDSPNVTGRSLSDLDVEGVDVVIDFSSAEGAYENMLFYAGSSLSAVVGTTGWYDRLEELKNNLVGQNCSIIYSGNFSIGVAIMLRASAYISSLMNRAASYDVAIEEIHHRAKSDCPSGNTFAHLRFRSGHNRVKAYGKKPHWLCRRSFECCRMDTWEKGIFLI